MCTERLYGASDELPVGKKGKKQKKDQEKKNTHQENGKRERRRQDSNLRVKSQWVSNPSP